jgi:RimJ/RimL family protein N-acetyltransferase
MASDITFRPGRLEDASALLGLYQAVAAQPGSLARRAEEMEPAYVEGFVASALKRGVWLLAQDAQGLLGSIHACRPLPQDFQHVLGELTLVVHPRAQGQGLGSALFAAFLGQVREREPQIQRIELITRDSNQRARRIYEKLGFRQEGRLRGRVRHADGRLEDDLFYAWLRNEQD